MVIECNRSRNQTVENSEESRSWANDDVAYVNAAASFRAKLRIETVEGNTTERAASSHRRLRFGEEMMRLRGGGIKIHRMEIEIEFTRAEETNVEKVRGDTKPPLMVVTSDEVGPGGTFIPPPKEGTPKQVIFSQFDNFAQYR